MIFQLYGKQKKKETIVYTILACTTCNFTQKRKFEKGDVVFSKTQQACTSCKGIVTVEQIFSEEVH